MHIWKLHIATCEIAIPIAVRDIRINAHFVTIDAEITSDEAPMLFTDQLGSHKGIVLTILSFL